MLSFQLTTTLLGLGLAVLILLLVRRDHLRLRHGLFWIVVALFALLLGIWPRFIDKLAGLTGISYSPALLLLVAVVILMLKTLQNDITATRTERRLRRLNQQMALYEAKLAQEQKDKSE